MGTSWPRFSAYADSGTDQASTSFFSPTGRGTLFSSSNPFFVPPGGRGSLNVNENAAAAGQQLRYELLDFARTPKARSALADQDVVAEGDRVIQRELHAAAEFAAAPAAGPAPAARFA